LKSDNGEEQTGSSSYVTKEKEKDKQLRAASDLLHGKQVVSNTKSSEADNKVQGPKQADDKATPQAPATTNN
jgi:carboxyl-terminal processing protease